MKSKNDPLTVSDLREMEDIARLLQKVWPDLPTVRESNELADKRTDYERACVHEEDMSPEQKASTVFRDDI